MIWTQQDTKLMRKIITFHQILPMLPEPINFDQVGVCEDLLVHAELVLYLCLPLPAYLTKLSLYVYRFIIYIFCDIRKTQKL